MKISIMAFVVFGAVVVAMYSSADAYVRALSVPLGVVLWAAWGFLSGMEDRGSVR